MNSRWNADDDPYTFDDDLQDAASEWLEQAEARRNAQPVHKPVDNAPKLDDQNKQTDIQPNDWMTKAACKGSTHKMFPREHKDITYIAEARQICNQCTVKPDCLKYALSFPPGDMHGVWAGLTPRQLAKEQQRLKLRPTVPTLAQMWQDLQ